MAKSVGEIIEPENERPKYLDQRGGARPNSGRPKGSMDEDTRLRRNAERLYKQRVAAMTDRLLNAQLTLALGETSLYKKTKRGNKTITTLVDDPEVIKQYLNGDLEDGDNEYFYLATKSPDNKALDSLLDRTYGKARQAVDITSDDQPINIQPVSQVVIEQFQQFMLESTKRGDKSD